MGVQSLQGWIERSVRKDGKDLVHIPGWLGAPSGLLCTENHLTAALAHLWGLGMPDLPSEDLSGGSKSWPTLGWPGPIAAYVSHLVSAIDEKTEAG